MEVFDGKFGPLAIRVKGSGELYNRLCDELVPASTSSHKEDAAPDLSIVISDSRKMFSHYKESYSSAKEHMTFNEDTFFYDQPVPYLCKNLFNDQPCELIILDRKNKPIKTKIRNLAGTKINSKIELSYSLFWLVIQVLLVYKGYSFIHAGVFSKNNKALAFMGTGGSGKTSNMFNYLSKPEYKYLAEDFGIINTEGMVELSSKTLSIYDSDVKSDTSLLKDLNKHLQLKEKLKWSLIKRANRNPMVKLPVRAFFDKEKIAGPAYLSKAFYIIRCDDEKPSISSLEIDELAERMVNVTFREMKKLTELLNLINANSPNEYNYPTVELLRAKTRSIYLKAFEKSDLYLLKLPFKCGSKEVEEFLSSKEI